MRIVDALVEVLKEHESLTYKEAYLELKIQKQQSMQNYVVIVKD